MGYSVGGSCKSDAVEAASAFCSAYGGSTSSGVVTAESCTVTASTVNFQQCLTRPDASGALVKSCSAATQPMPVCEPYDFAYYAPALGAFSAALVAILAARMVFRLFDRDTL